MGAGWHHPHHRFSGLDTAQLQAPGRDVQPVCSLQLRARNRDVHWLRLCALGETVPRLQHAHVYPQNSANPDHQARWESQTAEAAPGCLSVTRLRGPGRRLGKLPWRSKDKPSSLGFSQWTGIFSSGLVAALPASCVGVSRPREAPPAGERSPRDGSQHVLPGLTQRHFVLPPSRHHPSRHNLTAGSTALIPPRLPVTRGAASAAVGTHGTGKSYACPSPSRRLCAVGWP